jgi:F420-dependent oxidoreductase-like protein
MPVTPPRRVRFGVQLQAQRTTWPEYANAVQAVESLGFDTLWNFDHLLPWCGDAGDPCFETWTTLTAMAMLTKRIRIGTLVNGVLYRDPATLAKSAAMVDIISEGRLEFSLGAAWAELEFAAYGLPFPPIGERISRLDEALDIVKALWSQPRTTYEGRYYQVHDAPFEPKPVQRPHPPIMVGGTGRRTMRLAAKHADIWNGNGRPEECAALIERLHAECAAIGRDPAEIELSIHPHLAIARSREAARARLETITRVQGLAADDPREQWLLGTPDEVKEQIQAYVDVDITHIIMGVPTPFDLESLRLFADEVMPAFRSPAPPSPRK